MLIMAFLQWWYGPGWQDTATRVTNRTRALYLEFSVPILLRTLLSPWRRIITAGEGSFGQRGRALVDNAVSRLVGFMVRVIALFTALILMGLTIGLGGLLVLVWPLVPVAGIALLVLGVGVR
jgi:hypothetical protein